MKRSTTHIHDNYKPHKQFETPRKAKVQGAVEFFEKQGMEYFKNDVFRTFNVSHTRGYEYLQNLDSNCKIDDNEARRL